MKMNMQAHIKGRVWRIVEQPSKRNMLECDICNTLKCRLYDIDLIMESHCLVRLLEAVDRKILAKQYMSNIRTTQL